MLFTLFFVLVICTHALDGRVPLPFKHIIDTKHHCPELRIAVINGVNFHFEVLSGLLHLLQPFEKHVDVFLSPYARTANFDGAWELVRWSKAVFRRTDKLEKVPTYDIAILVSPDYELQANEALITAMKPKITISIVHNANYEHMDKLLAMAPNMELLTLSPHVASALARNTGRKVGWMLAVYPVPLEDHCASVAPEQYLGMCLRGFSMQGKFSNLRRNYTSMWRQISDKLEQVSDPQVGRVFHMHVLGKGPDRLALPPSLAQYVTVHRRLQYRPFYTVIGRTVALVPSLASMKYFTEKFSSTVMTSLQTTTPIIAGEKLLKAYSFLSQESVFQQQEGEEEMDAMLRISRMTPENIQKTRAALANVRERMNERAFAMLEAYIKKVCTPDAKEGGGGRRVLATGGREEDTSVNGSKLHISELKGGLSDDDQLPGEQ